VARVRPPARVLRRALAVLALGSVVTAPAPAAAAERGEVRLRAGYSAQAFVDVDLEEARAVTKIWSDMILARNFEDGTAETVILEDADAMLRAFREDRLDVAALISDEYLRLREEVPLEPVFVTAHAGGIHHQIGVLVRRDRGLRRLGDLSGRQLTVSVEQAGTIHSLWLETVLLREGLPGPATFFGSVKTARKPSQAILPVFFGMAEACLTTRESFALVCELNPQVGRDLEFLARSPEVAAGVIVFRPGYDPASKAKVTRALATLHQDSQGRQLLRLFRMDRLVPFEEGHLDSVAALLAEQRALLLARRR